MSRKRTVIEFAVFSLVFGLLAGLLSFMGYSLNGSESTEVFSKAEDNKLVIIDAGHGGVDGGASGVNGALEKELNLEVSEKLKALCEINGYEVIMTRDSDISLGEGAQKGHVKMTDLKRRLEIAKENPDALFISLHMNKYPQADCKGIQIWYSGKNENSLKLAGILENAVKTKLQPDNKRKSKQAGSSIYLLERIENTAVLVECGFLSNEEECTLLCDSDYQTKLAACIYYAIDEFYGNVG